MDEPLAKEIRIRNPNGGWTTITNSAHIEHMSETLTLRVAEALGVTYCSICANVDGMVDDPDAVVILDDHALVYQFHHWFGGACWEGYICPGCEDQLPEDYIYIQCQGEDEDEDLPSCEGAKCICRCQILDCKAAVTRGTYVVKPSSW